MILVFTLLLAVGSVLLVLSSFAQLLYLESMRLRPRDLRAMKYFRETLENRIGFETERGAACFSVLKHSLMVGLSILVCAWFSDQPGRRAVAETFAGAWLSMMLFSYIVPQFLYRRTEAAWTGRLAPLFRVMAFSVLPVVAVLDFFQSLVELADEDQDGEETEPTAAENIEALITAGREEGLIEEQDSKLIQSVVEFGDKTVREIMTPRPSIVAIQADAALDELRQLLINEQYSRIPVYEKDIDEVSGFVHVRDIFEQENGDGPSRTVRELMRPIRFVPESKPVSDLMREMQQEGAHMVMVVDEYGTTAGLATMEDLVEVIVGEIRDEHEPASDITGDGHGGYVVSGSFDLARLNDLFEFRPEEDIESTTVGGLVSEWLGRVPRPGESIERHGLRIEVLAGDERRVEKVRISKSPTVAYK